MEEAQSRANSENIIVPFGVGICGHVAQTKERVVLKNAYEDSRFNDAVDSKTGYKTSSLVCMPVCNYDGEVIGVAQIMNKEQGEEFTEMDLKVFERYLTFCGIGIQNAQLFEVSILEYKKNQVRTIVVVCMRSAEGRLTSARPAGQIIYSPNLLIAYLSVGSSRVPQPGGPTGWMGGMVEEPIIWLPSPSLPPSFFSAV